MSHNYKFKCNMNDLHLFDHKIRTTLDQLYIILYSNESNNEKAKTVQCKVFVFVFVFH